MSRDSEEQDDLEAMHSLSEIEHWLSFVRLPSEFVFICFILRVLSCLVFVYRVLSLDLWYMPE